MVCSQLLMVCSQFWPVVGFSHSDTCSLHIEDGDGHPGLHKYSSNSGYVLGFVGKYIRFLLAAISSNSNSYFIAIALHRELVRFLHKCMWLSPLAHCWYPNQIGTPCCVSRLPVTCTLTQPTAMDQS